MPADDEHPAGPYYTAAAAYYRAGWPAFPVVGKAINIPRGVTGRAGQPIEYATVVDWMVSRPDDNIALRLNGVIGIDVDDYDKDGTVKRGAETLATAERLWGPLPPTWRSTSRPPDNPSGIRFYRVPKGLDFTTIVKLPNASGDITGDIEIIQHAHRYAVVWPSVHPDTAATYRWYTPEGQVSLGVPDVLGLPVLPQRWVDELTLIRPTVDTRPAAPVAACLALPADWHPKVTEHYQAGLDAASGPSGSRHDNTLAVVGRLARDESRGRAGATTALGMLRERFVAAISDDRQRDPAREFESMVDGSRALVATTVSTVDAEREAVLAVFASIPTASTAPPPAPGEPVDGPAPAGLASYEVDWNDLWNTDPDASEWLCEPLIPAGSKVTHIYAPRAEGKSALSLYLAAGLATGRPILDRPASAPLTVAYIDVEMSRTELRDYLEEFGYGPDTDLSGLRYIVDAPIPYLDTVEGGLQVFDWVKALDPDVVFVDSITSVLKGEENSNDAYQQLFNCTISLFKRAGIPSVWLGNSGKNKELGSRGGSRKEDLMDCIWRMERCDGGLVNLHNTKKRAAWIPSKVALQRDVADDGLVTYATPQDAINDIPVGSIEVAQLLDDLGLPAEVSTRTAAKALKAAGSGRRMDVIRGAIRYRNWESAKRSYAYLTDGTHPGPTPPDDSHISVDCRKFHDLPAGPTPGPTPDPLLGPTGTRSTNVPSDQGKHPGPTPGPTGTH